MRKKRRRREYRDEEKCLGDGHAYPKANVALKMLVTLILQFRKLIHHV